jgi:hypothetical protein
MRLSLPSASRLSAAWAYALADEAKHEIVVSCADQAHQNSLFA